MWTKRDLINAAFAELGITSSFDITPDEYQVAMRRLDSMMAAWSVKGIRLGYPLGNGSDLDDDSRVPDISAEAVIANLAVRLGPGLGKTMPQETKALAKLLYDALIVSIVRNVEMQMPRTMPMGAGNRGGPDQRFVSPTGGISTGQDGPLEF